MELGLIEDEICKRTDRKGYIKKSFGLYNIAVITTVQEMLKASM